MKTPKTSIFSATEPPADFKLTCTWTRHKDDNNVRALFAADGVPDVIVTIGPGAFRQLNSLPLALRKRWIHFETYDKVREASLMYCMMSNVVTPFALIGDAHKPLISVFTPSYKSKDRIQRPLKSLLEMDYGNWEWIVVCDTCEDDGGENWKQLQAIAERDYRIRVFRPGKHNGAIGAVKRDSAGLCRGKLLVEVYRRWRRGRFRC